MVKRMRFRAPSTSGPSSDVEVRENGRHVRGGGRGERGRQGASTGLSSSSPRKKTWLEMEMDKIRDAKGKGREQEEQLQADDERMIYERAQEAVRGEASAGSSSSSLRRKTWFEMELEKKMREDQEKDEKLQAEAERMIIESASLPSSRPKTWFEIELSKKIQADKNMGESSKVYIEPRSTSPTFSLPTSPTPDHAQLPISPLQLEPSQLPKTWFQIELEKKAQADRNDEEPSKEYIEPRARCTSASPTFPLPNSSTPPRDHLPLSPSQPSLPHLSPEAGPSIKPEPLPALLPTSTNRPPVPEHEIIDVDTYVYVDRPAQPSTSTSQAGLIRPVRTRRRVVRETSGPRPYARKRNGTTSGSSLESLDMREVSGGRGDGALVGSSRVGGAWERAERRARASATGGSTSGYLSARLSGTASGSGRVYEQTGSRGRS